MQLRSGGEDVEVCLLVSATPIRRRETTAVVLTLENVSDVHLKDHFLRAEEALLQAHERANSLARFPEENPDPVLRLGSDLSLAYANPAARSLGGPELVVGRRATELFAGPARQALAEGRRVFTEATFAGRTFAFSFCLAGAEVNVYGQDVSDRKRAADALAAEKERLAAAEEALRDADRHKNEFLAMLSHELRNPLAAIRSSLELLGRVPGDGPQAAGARAVLERQAGHLTRLVDELLDVTRISRGKVALRRSLVDLCRVVRDSCRDHRFHFEEAGVSLQLEGPPGPLWIDADAARVTQVVGNLLHNAAKFSARGGWTAVGLASVDGCAELRVRDGGAGIDARLLARLFEPFAQGERGLARGGLGLGLSLVKRLVELHGGSVRALSEGANRGAELVVRLPLACAPPLART
jgi:signal transduction histidine kinase